MTCAICGNQADLDGDGFCEECALEGWGDQEPQRPIEDVPVIGGVL